MRARCGDLAKALTEKGLSVTELAGRLELGRTTVSKAANGETTRRVTALAIAGELGMPVEALFDEDPVAAPAGDGQAA